MEEIVRMFERGEFCIRVNGKGLPLKEIFYDYDITTPLYSRVTLHSGYIRVENHNGSQMIVGYNHVGDDEPLMSAELFIKMTKLPVRRDTRKKEIVRQVMIVDSLTGKTVYGVLPRGGIGRFSGYGKEIK